MADLFWLSDAQWAVMEPFMPRNQPGARRVDDRRTISGIVQVIKSGCRWRDCPAAYGPHTTVYNRFNRWSRRGFWRAMLAAPGGGGLGSGDRCSGFHLREGAPLCPRPQRGAKAQAIGVSRGGQTTKVHVITDILGRPAVIHLTPGNASDVKVAPEVIAAVPGRFRRLVADRGYDADALRGDLRSAGRCPSSRAAAPASTQSAVTRSE